MDGWLGELFTAACQRAGAPDRGVALLAVGGYGRGQLFPYSDLDLVLVHAGGRGGLPAIGQLAEALWYPIWDAGLALDHSVRTVKEALTIADRDLKAATGLLEGRLVAGDAEVAAAVVHGAERIWRDRRGRWLPALDQLTRQRHAASGEVAFLLEPDLKEGRGGLRDITVLRAAARATPVLAGVLADPQLEGAGRLLRRVRVELHRRARRSLDVLLLQEQDGVAAALGYADADRLMADVAGAARGVAWADNDGWRRVRSWLAGPRSQGTTRGRPLAPGVILQDGEVTLAPLSGQAQAAGTPGAPAEPRPDPTVDAGLPLRLAAASAREGVPIASAALARLARETPAPPVPWPDELRASLVELLATGPPAIDGWEALDRVGLLERLLPEWSAVRNKPQRNAYHRFTVDRHLCEAAAQAAERAGSVARPDLLLVGTWLHDIGKGFPGDHTEVGERVIAEVGARMGFPPADVAVLVSLVRHHLLLADVATRRDLDDPATVDAVAGAVGDVSTLRLLGVLTEADSRATGPSAWSDWKGALVAELIDRTERRLAGHDVQATRSELPSAAHRRLMASGELHVMVEGADVTVIAPDRPGLLATVAGVLALHRLPVRAAAAASDGRGMAVEVFTVDPAAPAGLPDGAALARELARALDAPEELTLRLAERARTVEGHRRPRAARPAETRVSVDAGASSSATVVEVRAPDGPGLLHQVAAGLASAGLDVVSARITTVGHQAVDAFYVRTSDGAKLVGAEAERVAAAVRSAIAGHAISGQ